MSSAKNSTRYPNRYEPPPDDRDNPVWVLFCVGILLALVWFGFGGGLP